MMNDYRSCTYHPQKDAIALCKGCGRPFCQECLVELSGKPYCRPCAQVAACTQGQSASGLALTSLILSVVSIGFCGVTAIPGMILGYMELGKINRGESPESGRGIAKAGAIIGTVMTALLLLSIMIAIIITVVGIVIAILAGS